VQDYVAKNGEKLEAYYKAHPARFDRPKRMRARHILVSAPESAPQDAQEAAKKKIDALAERVKKGEDFAKLAQESSDDPGSKAKGGDLGFFGPGVMAKPFEDAAAKLSPGQVSEPIRTQFGWHLVKLEAVEPAKKETLDEAKQVIARELLEDEAARKLAAQRADETLKKLQAGKSFAEALPAKGAQVKLGGQPIVAEETGPFPASSAPNVPKLGPAPELFADAVKATAGQVLPRAYETAGGPVVARVKERQRADDSKFAERKADVETRLRLRRESELERAWVEALRKKAKVQTNEAFVLGTVRSGPVDLD
jgi:peptidyl-prolyl cis-trans isomerase D